MAKQSTTAAQCHRRRRDWGARLGWLGASGGSACRVRGPTGPCVAHCLWGACAHATGTACRTAPARRLLSPARARGRGRSCSGILDAVEEDGDFPPLVRYPGLLRRMPARCRCAQLGRWRGCHRCLVARAGAGAHHGCAHGQLQWGRRPALPSQGGSGPKHVYATATAQP